jgi:butyryl-CoA dehydrogenase
LIGGAAGLRLLIDRIEASATRARNAGVDGGWLDRLQGSVSAITEVTRQLAALGDPEATLRHSFDYLEMVSIVVIAWQWIEQAAAAKEGLTRLSRSPSPDAGADEASFYEGKLAAAQYWIHTELPRVGTLGALCRSGEDSYARAQSAWF